MKNEKHVALAKELLLGFDLTEFQRTEITERIAAALSQVEAEALASKVVGPSDEDIEAQASKYSRDIEFEHPYGDFKNGAKWVLSQLTLAPNEPTKECQCEELKQMIQKAQDNLKKNMELLTAPKEQVIRVPKKATNNITHRNTFHEGKICGFNLCVDAIKRLNPTATIEESNE